MGMGNQCNVAAALIIIICINNFVNVLLRFLNARELIRIKINEIHCVIELLIEECAVILIKGITARDIKQQLKIPHQILHGVIDGADISALKNLAAAANGKAFGLRSSSAWSGL
jgi:hypothetical protein